MNLSPTTTCVSSTWGGGRETRRGVPHDLEHRIRNNGERGATQAAVPKAADDVALDSQSVSYTHLRARETKANLVCRLLLEKKKKKQKKNKLWKLLNKKNEKKNKKKDRN